MEPALAIEEPVRETETLGNLAGLVIQGLLAPMVVVDVQRRTTGLELSAIVRLEGGGKHDKDLLRREERLGDGNGGTRLSGPEAVVEQETAIGRLRRQVIANDLLMGQELACPRVPLETEIDVLVFLGRGRGWILQKDASDCIRKGFPIWKDVRSRHCFS